jgi:membrane fusion protein (multidrug efflux system)
MSNQIENYTATDRLITKTTSVLAIIVAIALVILGVIYLWNYCHYTETNDAQVQEYINPVVTRVSGYISEIRYEENQPVKKGDTLVIIDKSQFELAKNESEEALTNAEAQMEVLESSIITNLQNADVILADGAASHARLVKEQQEFDRYTKLYQAESATRQQLENVKAELDIASAGYRSTLSNHKAALFHVDEIRKQKSSLSAEIKRRETIVSSSKLELSYTAITAPYNGKMGKKTIQAGQFIQANQTLAFIVNKDGGKWIVANFKETQVSQMRVGQAAEIEIDAFPNETYHGIIQSLSPATGSSFSLLPPDNSTGNFVKTVQRIPVRIAIQEKNYKIDQLTGGMNATVRIRKDER